MRFNANFTLNCVDIHGLSIGKQVTAFHCSSTRIDSEITLDIRNSRLKSNALIVRFQWVSNANSTRTNTQLEE